VADPLSPEIRDLLTLHLLPGLGPRLTAALLKRFGSAAEVLRVSAAALQEVPHIGDKLANSLVQAMRQVRVEDELQEMDRHGVRLLVQGTSEYPAALAEIEDAPHLLYCRGGVASQDARAVALVGSRHCTAYGRRVTERLATGLVRAGYTVVSGLARGIDGFAHRAALKAGGRTLAVLAGGLSSIYPPEHADLAGDVAQSGAILSEANMRMEPMAGMFPARNRIISGLCQGVVIVEAAERSGALITASHAGDQGRTVFAVPGPVDSAASSGALELLRKGAIIVRGVEDILEELEGVKPAAVPARAASAPAGLDETQQRLWEFLAERPRHLDEMVQQLGLSVPQITGALLTLEMKQAVRRLPGNRYERR
jgi:DNA processing protein